MLDAMESFAGCDQDPLQKDLAWQRELRSLMHFHFFAPVSMGSGHTKLSDKFYKVMYQMFLDWYNAPSGSSSLLTRSA